MKLNVHSTVYICIYFSDHISKEIKAWDQINTSNMLNKYMYQKINTGTSLFKLFYVDV